jgi:hypothetical protein
MKGNRFGVAARPNGTITIGVPIGALTPEEALNLSNCLRAEAHAASFKIARDAFERQQKKKKP